MTSRQRVLAAMARRPVDRVPLDLGGTESSGLTGVAWHRLERFLAAGACGGGACTARDKIPQIVDPLQQVARVSDSLRKLFGIDTAALFIEPAKWTDDTLADGSPCRSPAKWRPTALPNGDRVVLDDAGRPVARMPRCGFYFDPVAAKLAGCATPADLRRHRDVVATCDLPGYCDEPIDATATRARQMHDADDSPAVVFNFCCHLLHGGTGLRGYEQFMMDLALDRPMAETLLDMLLEVYLERIDRYAPRLRGVVDVVLFNDDLGTQAGPMISPAVYRELIQPRQAQLFGRARSAFAAPILFHSCGSVRALIGGLIEAGVDALNPVQVSAEGMDSAGLKRDFGNDVCFWGGGCDTQTVLCRGTESQVRAEVARRVADFSPGGGFVFTQVHNVQPDVPPANVVAMLDEFAERR